VEAATDVVASGRKSGASRTVAPHKTVVQLAVTTCIDRFAGLKGEMSRW